MDSNFNEGTLQGFGKWSRAALLYINGGGTESGTEVGCTRELGIQNWGAREDRDVNG